ncbi:hypothetical protein A3L04_09885 [Thermococcus chitonophagus]|uniref:Glycosyltransferase RgtA/B/C/D-like domain-containing protein n=1 Tax=Thermococcus chitonophagus TaxID=54262 RepID=A0A2Z2N8H7_9EURY|nr:hypothetical protein A3L04_09885 [Thermococcus chitonophagus]
MSGGLILAFLFLSRHPFSLILATSILGFLTGSRLFKNSDPWEVLLLSPGIGFIVVILVGLFFGRIGIPFSVIWPTMAVFSVVLSLKTSIRIKIENFDGAVLLASIFLSFLVRSFYFLLPDYRAADTWFHGSKVKMILLSNTPYFSPSLVPEYFSKTISNYPPGYHVLVAFYTGGVSGEIIYAMNALRLFEIAYLPVATYLVGKKIKREIGLIAAPITSVSALYFYFVQYALLPAFFNYLLFLFSAFVLFEVREERSSPAILGIFGGTMGIVHPYQYIVFQIMALLVLRDLRKFSYQLATSLILMIIFMPLPQKYAEGTVKVNSYYPNKDNPEFLKHMLKYTFVSNGQIIFGLAFLLGLFVYRPISGTFFVILLIILNKIFFRVHVPVVSAIWNSERAFMLATPLIPIISAQGLYLIIRRWRSLGVFLLIAGIALAFPYVRIEHLASESSYLLDDETVDFILKVHKIVGDHEVLTACEFDSGRWIPILTDTPIKCYGGGVDNATYIYVDSRGAGELRAYPLDVTQLYSKYGILEFYNGLWLLSRVNKTSSRAIEKVCSYYLASGEISWLNSTKYFVHGFIIKNYATQKLRLMGYPYAVSVSKNSTILFCTKEYIKMLEIKIAVGKGREKANIYVDDRLALTTELSEKPKVLRIPVNLAPGLHDIRILCNCSYLNPLGVEYVRFEGG